MGFFRFEVIFKSFISTNFEWQPYFSYIPKIQLIKLSSIALVAKFIKFYYVRSLGEIVQFCIIQLRIVAILAQGATTTTCFVHFVKFSPFYGLIRTFLHQKLSHMFFKDTRRFVLQSAGWIKLKMPGNFPHGV